MKHLKIQIARNTLLSVSRKDIDTQVPIEQLNQNAKDLANFIGAAGCMEFINILSAEIAKYSSAGE